jgi:putative DNA methylase
MTWDYCETNPIGGSTGSIENAIDYGAAVIQKIGLSCTSLGQTQQSDARDLPLPDAGADIWFTDPPYYDNVPYSYISDFFYVWLKRTIKKAVPELFTGVLSPKENEIVAYLQKDNDASTAKHRFESMMAKAFLEGRRIVKDDGLGCVVFAHKTTEGWEAFLSGLISGGLVITSSWPIVTERVDRPRAYESAALATSVHLICRPRPKNASVGDWGDVLRELPKRVGDWMERLQEEGIRGADLVFACIGPALEIFSQYSSVVDPQEREIPLGGNPEASDAYQRGFLSYVWEVVGRKALEQVLTTADSKARNGAAGAVEEDARLTALFLWTLQSTNGNETDSESEAKTEEDEAEEEGKDSPKKKKKPGFSLIFDVVRRFAQPLGIHLPEWEGRIIETEKGVVRLLSIQERAKALFGEDGAQAVADRLESSRGTSPQLMLFPQARKDAPLPIKGRKKKAAADVSVEALRTQRGATTLDRVHAAMLLQANGRANALRTLLKDEQERGPDFLRLANALSALYPKDSEEKRLLDAMVLAMPR